jgi:hypothetical protein
MELARPRGIGDTMSGNTRIQKYDAKLDPAHVATVLTSLKPNMVNAETSVFSDQENLQYIA